MKKFNIQASYAKKALIAAVILIVLYVVIACMKSNNIYIFIQKMSSDEILPLLFFIIAILCFSSLYSFIKANSYNKWPLYAMTICVSLFGLYYIFIHVFFTPSFEYYDFYSEIDNHHIIVKEESFLLMGSGDVYEMIGPQIMTPIGSYGADDGYRPIHDNKYYFEWKEDMVTLHYCFESFSCKNESDYTSTEMKYAK